MPGVSVVIPVRDGERHLGSLLTALRREQPDEVLVIDSGSRDRSLEIARAAGVEILEIEASEFGHGRTRNLGAERTSGELICFLTQDAVPVAGWLDAYREAFDARRARRRGLRPAPPARRHEPHDRPRADRVLRRLRAERPPRRAGPGRSGLPLERQCLLFAGLLAGDPLPRSCLRRGPRLRQGDARGWVDEGLPPGRGRRARPRLRPHRVHAPLLRRVSRAARNAGPRRADNRPRAWRDDAAPGELRPALDGCAGVVRWPAHPMGCPLGRAPLEPPGVRGARIARRAVAGRRSERNLPGAPPQGAATTRARAGRRS